MNKNFILWGSAGHAKVLADIISLSGGHVIALFDNEDVKSALAGVPLHIGESDFRRWAEEKNVLDHSISGAVAIGGDRGQDRISILKLFREYNFNIPVLFHPTAVISPSASIGPGSQILAHANVAADAHLGEGCIINHHSSVDHECQLGNGVHIAPGATLCGCVIVGDNSFIGAGATILPRLQVGKNSTVGAGAVVTRNVPSGVVVVGNPAKEIHQSKNRKAYVNHVCKISGI
jgi:sugar O-acyltransferase (sialic acid O-acetyltransferase NeuD family)